MLDHAVYPDTTKLSKHNFHTRDVAAHKVHVRARSGVLHKLSFALAWLHEKWMCLVTKKKKTQTKKNIDVNSTGKRHQLSIVLNWSINLILYWCVLFPFKYQLFVLFILITKHIHFSCGWDNATQSLCITPTYMYFKWRDNTCMKVALWKLCGVWVN